MKYKITCTFEQIVELPDFDKEIEKDVLETVIFDKLEDDINRNNSTPEVVFWSNLEWSEENGKS